MKKNGLPVRRDKKRCHNCHVFLPLLLPLLISAAFAETPRMAACRAGYESFEPMKVFEGCGAMIADGEPPEDPRVWDWLGLAQQTAMPEYENEEVIKQYLARSRESGGKTWDKAVYKYSTARTDEEKDRYFEEALSFGKWESADFYRYLGKWQSNRKEALPLLTKSIKIFPTIDALYLRGVVYSDMNKDSKAREDLDRAIEMAARFGNRHSRALNHLGYIDKSLRQTAEAVPLPDSLYLPDALRNQVVALANAGRTEEALAKSAALIAFKPNPLNYVLRGDLHSKRGDHLMASQNYRLAMQEDSRLTESIMPRYRAAIESHAAAHCATPPANLMELVQTQSPLVHTSKSTDIRYVNTGLRTQWQTDGSLRFFIDNHDGFYLLPDGIRFQRAQAGGRGPVEEPVRRADGALVYAAIGNYSVAFFPSGAMYFGQLRTLSADNEGRYTLCSGMMLAGPYLNGLPTQLIRQEGVADEGSVKVTRFTNGIRREIRNDRLPRVIIPGTGTFQGIVRDEVLPGTGVLTTESGTVALYMDGRLVATGDKGVPISASAGGGRLAKMTPAGDLEILDNTFTEDIRIIYEASGRLPYEVRTIRPGHSPAEILAAEQARERKQEIDDAYRALHQMDFSRKPVSCYRCGGSGRIWQAGGASQSTASTPSGYSAAEAANFRNSAQSVQIVYSSGQMVTCPVCGGSGSY